MRRHPRHRHLHDGRRHRFWNPLTFYVQHRLQRRLFVWFGVNILLTGVVVAFVMHLVSSNTNSDWGRLWDGGRKFLGAQFGEVWNDKSRRDALAQKLSNDTGAQVELTDGAGRVLYGAPCSSAAFEVPTSVGPDGIGKLRICGPTHGPANLWRVVLPIGLALFMLWAASGRLAWRLSRPLVELAHVAGELGQGKLSARVPIHRHTDGEVRVVAEAVNEMAARIEKQLSDQRELLAAVSHELRTPLQRIRIITELARGGAVTKKTLDSLDQEVIELDALVGDLLANSRLDFGQLTRKALDSNDVASRALERAGLSAELLVAKDSVVLDADATLVARALANLLENARRHGGGAKALTVTPGATSVIYAVDDAGPGFGNDELGQVFDPFFRRPKTTEAEAASLGLGLSLVKRVAQAHGGRAFAENRPEGGARVGFELPLRAAA